MKAGHIHGFQNSAQGKQYEAWVLPILEITFVSEQPIFYGCSPCFPLPQTLNSKP